MIWALLIAVLSFLPGSSFPKTEITRADLLVHFTFYAILSYLWYVGFFRSNPQKPITKSQYFTVIASSILFSGLIELIQGTEFVARSCELSDLIANSVGCLIGTVLFLFQPLKMKMLWIVKRTERGRQSENNQKPSS